MIRIQQQRGKGAGPRHAAPAWAAFLAPTVLALLAALGTATARAQPVSPAEVLLFETDHLARTKVPAALIYDFRKVSNIEPGFTDTVELDLTKENGQMHARLRFLSGERKRELPDIDDAHGNPVLLGFLEHDIAEMKRLTGGSTTYFRKRIRMALANVAQVSRQAISFQGKSYDGQVVRIQPYLDDPLHARFEAYVHKTYTFILSDAVPGGIYQVSTSLGTSGSGRAINAAAGGATNAAANAAADGATNTAADGATHTAAGAAAHAKGNAAAAGASPGALADARVAKRPGNGAGSAGKAGGVQSGTARASENAAAPTGTAAPRSAVTPNGTAAADAAAARAARPGTQGTGAAAASKAPSLEETLTLVRVADPKR